MFFDVDGMTLVRPRSTCEVGCTDARRSETHAYRLNQVGQAALLGGWSRVLNSTAQEACLTTRSIALAKRMRKNRCLPVSECKRLLGKDPFDKRVTCLTTKSASTEFFGRLRRR